MSEQASLSGEQSAEHGAPVLAESPAPIPSEAIPPEPGHGGKKNAESRIKELGARNKHLWQQNDALRAENYALKESAVELQRQADEADSLRAQIVTLEKREVEWQWLAIDTVERQAQTEKEKQIDAEQRRFDAWKLLIARSRHLAANSDYDSILAKGDRFFSTALLEQILQFELGPQIAYRLALNPKLCQQLSQATLAASALGIVQIESEIQAENLKKHAEQTFLKANGGW